MAHAQPNLHTSGHDPHQPMHPCGHDPPPQMMLRGHFPQPPMQPCGHVPQPSMQPCGCVTQPPMQISGQDPLPPMQTGGQEPQALMAPSGQDQEPPMPTICHQSLLMLQMGGQDQQPPTHFSDQNPLPPEGPELPVDKGHELHDPKNLYRISFRQKITTKPGGADYHPITSQPRKEDSISAMVHPSLRKLKHQEQITIHQQCSNYCCCILNSKYRVKDATGNLMFAIREETSFGMRCCCCWCRGFTMKIMDTEEQEVMQLRRPVTCGQCYWCCGNYCLPCCLSELDVCGSQPPYPNFGRVSQNISCFSPSFTCYNDVGRPAFHVTGNCCRFPCSNHKFMVKSVGNDKSPLGSITKKWTNCLTECCTNSHQLDIRFEEVTSVEDRIMMLSAAILIDFLYYT